MDDLPGFLVHPRQHEERLKAAKLRAQAMLPVTNIVANAVAEAIIETYFNPAEHADELQGEEQ